VNTNQPRAIAKPCRPRILPYIAAGASAMFSLAALPTISLVWCSSTTVSAQLTECLCDLAHHFKTEPTETVIVCFGYPFKHRAS
jgi:hypothetical protein